MLNLRVVSFAILVTLAPAMGEEFIFKQRGKVTAKLALEELTKKVAPVTQAVWEPHESRERKYRGIPFSALLTAVYGESWKKGTEELLFTCSDGYQPSIPVGVFKDAESFLAFASVDETFVVNNKFQNEKNVDLSPFYLVWDNLKAPKLKEEAGFWPYKIVGVDLIQFRDRFPHMAPPPGSSELITKGYLSFRSKCMNCHAINGEGAPKAVELNFPASVTEYFKEGWLEKWILTPTSVRYNTTMPALEGKDAKATAKAIISYLKLMAKHKLEPVKREEDH